MASTRMTDQVGRVLGGRYRLLAPLGVGASAQVYLADDERLRRRVAVKVLHAALADDEAFLRRFRAEAQAAAALNHPHIVAVYDWTGEGGTPFLVTEFLSGGSLRTLLDAGSRLTRSQALVVGLEAARALDHAHRQGFVHRDIKPANLLFGDDGRLRIADFGLARAIAEATWTEPQGAVLGTARYASPEQARGESVDGRSDVYSLAVVLVEAVTGVVPFAADTTIATLMARLDCPLEVPEELGPLRAGLEAAGRLETAERSDAAALGRALVAAAELLPRPAPLPLVPARPPGGAPGVEQGAAASAGAGPAGAASPGDAGAHARANGHAGPPRVEVSMPGVPAATVRPHDPTGVISLVAGAPPPDAADVTLHGAMPPVGGPLPPPAPPGARPTRRWLLVALGVLAAVALGVVGAVIVQQSRVPSHRIPAALVGSQQADVPSYVGDFGWRIDVQEERADDTEAGEILRTEPEPGTSLREGETLTIVVSLGPTLVNVPQDLAGLSQQEAEQALADAQLGIEPVPQPSEDVDEGTVIGLGEDVAPQEPKGSAVPVLVSSGLPPVEVPDVVGLRFQEAEDQLEDLDLEVERQTDPGSDGRRNEVVATEPAAGGEVERGGTVTVFVAGDGTAEIPDVRGADLDEAREQLEDAGLGVGNVTGPGDGQVLATFPLAGTEVEAGSQVQLFMTR